MGKKCAYFLGTSLKIRFQIVITQQILQTQNDHNNVLYVVFYYYFNDIGGFFINESEISPF